MRRFIGIWAVASLIGAALIGIGLAVDAAARTVCKPTVVLYSAGYPDADSSTAPAGAIPIPSPGGLFPWESQGYDHGQRVGAANAVRMMDRVAADCPHSQLRIHGHSYGAGIVHTALATIDHRPYAGRVHVYLTGDPRRIGGIEDTFAGWSAFGITMRGSGIIPSRVASYQNICHPMDLICSATPPWVDPVMTLQEIGGYLTGAHQY